MPSMDDIGEYIDNPLWPLMNSHIQTEYNIQPKIAYSKCSAQPGWNVKYAKSGKSLCTLYPMDGYFIALVVIGNKETDAAEHTLPAYCQYVQEIYRQTPFSAGGRWLMINVTATEILSDVLSLIGIRTVKK